MWFYRFKSVQKADGFLGDNYSSSGHHNPNAAEQTVLAQSQHHQQFLGKETELEHIGWMCDVCFNNFLTNAIPMCRRISGHPRICRARAWRERCGGCQHGGHQSSSDIVQRALWGKMFWRGLHNSWLFLSFMRCSITLKYLLVFPSTTLEFAYKWCINVLWKFLWKHLDGNVSVLLMFHWLKGNLGRSGKPPV